MIPKGWVIRSPGRVNLLGEHVDYNGGPVLPAAIDRVLTLEVQPRGDGQVHLQAVDLNATAVFHLDEIECKCDIHGEPLPAWARYPAGVAWSLKQLGLPLVGMNARFSSDIPIGAGLSSSAALEAAFAVLWQASGGWSLSKLELAQACLQAERDYVGLNCGILDQFAVLHGRAEHAIYLETATLDWQYVPLPAGSTIIITDSGQRRSLTDSGYNQRAAECLQALAILRQQKPDLRQLADLSLAEFEQMQDVLPLILAKRARHVVAECERTRQAVDVLASDDCAVFGELMLASHESLRDWYEVSTAELNRLVTLAMGQPGCFGSRMTGAGFGGCTVSLVDAQHADAFCAAMQAEGFQSFACQAAEGTSVI